MTAELPPGDEAADGRRIEVQRDAYIADVMHVHMPAPAPPPVPRDLPLDVFGFTGRSKELAELDDLIARPSGGHSQTVVISAISGTAGVGSSGYFASLSCDVKKSWNVDPLGKEPRFVDLAFVSACASNRLWRRAPEQPNPPPPALASPPRPGL